MRKFTRALLKNIGWLSIFLCFLPVASSQQGVLRPRQVIIREVSPTTQGQGLRIDNSSGNLRVKSGMTANGAGIICLLSDGVTATGSLCIQGQDSAGGMVIQAQGSALNINGSGTVDGQIVLNPGSLALGGVIINSGHIDAKTVTIKGKAGQTARMFEVQDSAGVRMFHIEGESSIGVAAGAMVARGIFPVSDDTYQIGLDTGFWKSLFVNEITLGNDKLIQWKDSAGTNVPVMKFTSGDWLEIGTLGPTAGTGNVHFVHEGTVWGKLKLEQGGGQELSLEPETNKTGLVGSPLRMWRVVQADILRAGSGFTDNQETGQVIVYSGVPPFLIGAALTGTMAGVPGLESISMLGHFVPASNNTWELGDGLGTVRRWKKAWLVDLDISGTCTGCGGGSGHWSDSGSVLTPTNVRNVNVLGTLPNVAVLFTEGVSNFGEFRLGQDPSPTKWSFGTVSDNWTGDALDPASFYIYQYTNAADSNINLYRFTIAPNGNVGIGLNTTNAATLFEVGGVSTLRSIVTPTDSTYDIGQSGANPRFRWGFADVWNGEQLEITNLAHTSHFTFEQDLTNNELHLRSPGDSIMMSWNVDVDRVEVFATLVPGGGEDIGMTGLAFGTLYVNSVGSSSFFPAVFANALDVNSITNSVDISLNRTMLAGTPNVTALGSGSARFDGFFDVIDVNSCSGCGAGSLPVGDTTSIVKGSVDSTKEIRFEVDGLTTGTIRTLTVQNSNYVLAGLDVIAQKFIVTQTFDGHIFADDGNEDVGDVTTPWRNFWFQGEIAGGGTVGMAWNPDSDSARDLGNTTTKTWRNANVENLQVWTTGDKLRIELNSTIASFTQIRLNNDAGARRVNLGISANDSALSLLASSADRFVSLSTIAGFVGLNVGGNIVVGPQCSALAVDATNLATALTLVNEIKNCMNENNHGLADGT